MARETDIQWCDSTVNPVMGCDGCELWTEKRRTCYAGILHDRYGNANGGYAKDFDEPEKFPGRTANAAKWSDLKGQARPGKPWLDGYPRLIFVSDMGDALSASIDFEYLQREIIVPATSDLGRRHIWLWLTKQPRRMLQFSISLSASGISWPRNIWPMTSITGRGTMGRAWDLRRIGDEHTIRGISFEPLDDEPVWSRLFERSDLHKPVHWAIFGGESGGIAPLTDIGMFERGVDEALRHGVAPFVKQLGKLPAIQEMTLMGRTLRPVEVRDSHGGDWGEWPERLRVRRLPEWSA
jgi:protein gp37